MDDPAEALGLPFKGLKTRQVIGSKAEIKMARARGARPHPMSGAGRIKDDASNDHFLYEFKNVYTSHGLRGKALFDLWRRGLRIKKQAIYVVYFEQQDITATIKIEKGRGTPDAYDIEEA